MFTFGNEFCTSDPLPGHRKTLSANVTCVRDSVLDHLVVGPKESDVLRQRRERVMHVKFDSQLSKGAEADFDVSQTRFALEERLEEDVFGAKCPKDPFKAGYRQE